jgi:hypothetical protein
MRTAQRAGLVDYADDAFRLANLSNVEVDDDGNVDGMDEVIEELIRSKPYLWYGRKRPRVLSADELKANARKTGSDRLTALRARYLGR